MLEGIEKREEFILILLSKSGCKMKYDSINYERNEKRNESL
jgi:hypothetical protein